MSIMRELIRQELSRPRMKQAFDEQLKIKSMGTEYITELSLPSFDEDLGLYKCTWIKYEMPGFKEVDNGEIFANTLEELKAKKKEFIFKGLNKL